MLDIVVQRNICLSDVTVCDILGSEHLSILFYILNNFSARDILAPT